MASLYNQTEVRREGAGVTGTSSLLIRVGRRHVVRELSWALEHLALVVGAVGVLDLLGHGLDLIGGVRDTDEVAPSDTVEGMAGRADLAVDLVAAADAGIGEQNTMQRECA